MDTPPPPPPYPSPQQLPDQLIIREAQNYTSENNQTSDTPHNQPLSTKPNKDTLLRTLSVDSSPSQLFKFASESKSNPNNVRDSDAKFSQNHIDKSKYVSKEQRLRLQQLEGEKEKYLWSSAYMARRVTSTSTIRSQQSGDFHNADWTPQDSAYGAAFPFCGWIPKGLREAFERFLVAVALVILVYTIVTVGMKLTNGLTGSRTKSDATVYTDDDFYVEETSYNLYYDDDTDDTDDLFDDNDNDNYRI